ncbi:anti-sigma F factor [Pseudobythopirellula maris]|uniref:Anti-sigma F factor n=1 Tax=Pseudobythopirellula maris TaxID=2527991 RepID=A0A5C5ZWN8_9BACT|nr:ATP-binding protein [Pseudobythopirellula maris]TWT90693.1 anti-sigma F factor [Pseudobythopirellula maris]
MSEEWTWSIESEFPSTLGAHLPVLEEVLRRIADLGWEGRDYFGVQMTLEESLTNAIRHGNEADPSKTVRVSCKASPERFWLRVEDEGEGFNEEDVPDCREESRLERLGGRGMLLIHAYMEEVHLNDCGNVITVQTHRGYEGPSDI